jgi:hypothetical protein
MTIGATDLHQSHSHEAVGGQAGAVREVDGPREHPQHGDGRECGRALRATLRHQASITLIVNMTVQLGKKRGDTHRWQPSLARPSQAHTSSLWLNWTVVGFSVTFRTLGSKAMRSSGIHLPCAKHRVPIESAIAVGDTLW